MSQSKPVKKPKLFYGYWIVLTAFLFAFIGSGSVMYGFSLFVKPLQDEFGWSRGGLMLTLTFFLLVTAISSPFVGRLVNRYKASRVIAIGALIQGVGFVLMTQIQDTWQLYAGYALIGMGMSATGIVPATTIVSNWFKKRRGTAIGIMATGVGGGGLALAPLIGGYIIPNFGWQVAYIFLAILSWVIIPIALLVVKTRPSDMGLYPDGASSSEAQSEAKASSAKSGGMSFRMAVGTFVFWMLIVSFGINGLTHLGILQNQVPYLEDIGFPVATAAGALGVVGLGSLVGKFGFGWFCDRLPAKYVWSIAQGLQVIAIAILLSLDHESPPAMLWIYAIIWGLGMGGWLPTMSILTSTEFGLASYSVIFGMMSAAQTALGAFGPPAAGFMYDAMGTYRQAFIIFLALYAVSIAAVLVLRQRKA